MESGFQNDQRVCSNPGMETCVTTIKSDIIYREGLVVDHDHAREGVCVCVCTEG